MLTKNMNDFATFYYCFCLNLFEIPFLLDNYSPALSYKGIMYARKYHIAPVRVVTINQNEAKNLVTYGKFKWI